MPPKYKIGRLILFLAAFSLISSRAFAYLTDDEIDRMKATAHYAMGQIYDLNGESTKALSEYEETIRLNPKAALPHLRLGTTYARLGMLKESIAELDLVKKIDPNDLQARYLLAVIYSSQKEYDKAANEYEYILKSFSSAEPENVEIFGYLGQLYYSQKKYDKAIEQFIKVLGIEPKNSDIMYILGSLYAEVGQKDQAIEILKRSIENDPEHDGSLNTLGYIYAENNEHLDEAQDLIQRALKVSPNNGAYLDSLGWVYYKKGSYEKALEIMKEADKEIDDPVIFEHLGDICLKLNKHDDALKYWEKSLDLEPNQESIIRKINELRGNQASNR